MSNHPKQETLDDVLNAYLNVTPEPRVEDLAAWVRQYPQYRDELTEFTVAHSLMLHLPPCSPQAIDEAALVTRGMSVVRTVLQGEREKQVAVLPPPASLLREGERQGLDLQQLAAMTDLSVVMWRKLDRCLLSPSSLPAQLLQRVADVIRQPVAVVQSYLALPPKLPAGAHYRARATPKLVEQEDFFDAVRKDLTLSDEQQQRWLALQSATSSDSWDSPQ